MADGIGTGILAAGRAIVSASVTSVMVARADVVGALARDEEPADVWDRHMRQHARAQLAILGVDLHVAGPLPPGGRASRLVVSSHRAAIDILIAQALFGGRILSRADLETWPVLGWLARRCGTIFVDRDSTSSGANAIRQIRRCLTGGETVTVFPEGTTHRGDEVQPFKPGVLVAVSGLDVEIVPMGVAYPDGAEYWQESFVAHLGRFARRPRTRVGVAVGEPRRTRARAAVLAEELHAEVQRLTHEARALVDR